jgi:hypothetical protein
MAVPGTRNLLNQQLAVGIEDEIVDHPETRVFMEYQASFHQADGFIGAINNVDQHALIDGCHPSVKYI